MGLHIEDKKKKKRFKYIEPFFFSESVHLKVAIIQYTLLMIATHTPLKMCRKLRLVTQIKTPTLRENHESLLHLAENILKLPDTISLRPY